MYIEFYNNTTLNVKLQYNTLYSSLRPFFDSGFSSQNVHKTIKLQHYKHII